MTHVAKKRMDGEDVFGSRISVGNPVHVNSFHPAKSRLYSSRTEEDELESRTWNNMESHPLYRFSGSKNGQGSGIPFYNQENVPILPPMLSWPGRPFKPLNGENIRKRPILGRRIELQERNDTKNGQANVSGRHSLDTMLEYGDQWMNTPTRRCWTPNYNIAASATMPALPPKPVPENNNSKMVFQPIPVRPVVKTQTSQENGRQEAQYCMLHSQPAVTSVLISVTVHLDHFSSCVVALLQTHANSLPLVSLSDCYAARFEKLMTDELAVPLEHLVTWVQEVKLESGPQGKILRLRTPADMRAEATNVCEHSKELSQLLSELIDLLKVQSRSQITLDRLTPVYNEMYSRKLKVAQYGCSKLIELLSKFSADIQIMGEGSDRIMTLTPRAQILRFKTDLAKVLQNQLDKRVKLKDLPSLWEHTLGHPLVPPDYGLSFLSDLLAMIPPDCVQGSTIGEETYLRIARKVPSIDEVEKIEMFANQMVELMNNAPEKQIEFDDLVLIYHKHFKTELNLVDYGCTKLAELLDNIPHAIKITRPENGVQKIFLVDRITLVLRTLRILWNQYMGRTVLSEFQQMFLDYYQIPCSKVCLEEKLSDVVKMVEPGMVQLCPLQLFAREVYRMLFSRGGQLPLTDFEDEYEHCEGEPVNPMLYGYQSVSQLLDAINHVVVVTSRGHTKLLQLRKEIGGVGIALPAGFETITDTNAPKQDVSENLEHTYIEPEAMLNGPKPALMTPSDFLRVSTMPLAPDASTLPLPPSKFIQGNDEDVRTCFLPPPVFDDNDQHRRKLRLAALFKSPIQLK